MAGHSQWANIKHRKALVDNKRGKLWSKLSKAIIVAAKMGGGDPDANHRLRQAILDARAVSVPKDNIERAIKKGTGELDGGNVEEMLYEGYGPGGVAILCEIMTDNRNRTAPEMRTLFEKHGGKLGATNCVAYLFERKGLFLFPAEGNEDNITMVALEGGGDDVQRLDSGKFEVTCPVEAFSTLSEAFATANLQPEMKQVTRIASNSVELNGDDAKLAMKLLEALDDHDDVQNVSTNLTVNPETMATIE
jgi:YebC/PmpR family DNA-binding regulatory protein